MGVVLTGDRGRVPGFDAFTLGDHHVCGLRDDATVACWGSNTHGQSDAPDGRFRMISAAGHYTCGVRVDDAVECWGRGWYGQTDPPGGAFRSV